MIKGAVDSRIEYEQRNYAAGSNGEIPPGMCLTCFFILIIFIVFDLNNAEMFDRFIRVIKYGVLIQLGIKTQEQAVELHY